MKDLRERINRLHDRLSPRAKQTREADAGQRSMLQRLFPPAKPVLEPEEEQELQEDESDCDPELAVKSWFAADISKVRTIIDKRAELSNTQRRLKGSLRTFTEFTAGVKGVS